MTIRTFSATGALLTGLAATAATAQPDTGLAGSLDTQVTVSAETQQFSKGYGELDTVKLEYKYQDTDNTVLVTPMLGHRRVGSFRDTAVGGEVTLYHTWSDSFSTRTSAFAAENSTVFANLDFSQDFTVKIAKATTLTAGGRWARYFGGREVSFLSLGARQYFNGGSIAYRVTRTDPEGRDVFYAHLVNLTLDDADGRGKTRLWLGTGATDMPADFDGSFTGQDYSAKLQRVQPLTDSLGLTVLAGYTSYDRPGGRVGGTTLGLGLSKGFE